MEMVKSVVDTDKPVEQPIKQQEIKSTPSEVDISLYDILECYGKDAFDPDTVDKIKFISDCIIGDKKDGIISILTELGATPFGTTKLERVYRFLKLREQADKVRRQGDIINTEIESIKTGIRSNWRVNQWD